MISKITIRKNRQKLSLLTQEQSFKIFQKSFFKKKKDFPKEIYKKM